MFTKASNIHFWSKRRYRINASRQVEAPFYRVTGRRGRRLFDALSQGIARTAIPFSCKYINPVAKRVGADFLEFAVLGIAFVVGGRKKLKTAAESVGRQTLRKQLDSCSRKKTTSRVNSWKSTKQSSRSQKDVFCKRSSLIISNNFRYPPFLAVSWSLRGKFPVVEDVLSSHEQEIYPITSLDETCGELEFQSDRNLYVDFRRTYLALKLKSVKGYKYQSYFTKELEESTKKRQKRMRKRRSSKRFQFLLLLM